jgi:hypothetical protein
MEGCREEVNIPQVFVEYASMKAHIVTPFVSQSYHSKQIFESRNLF